MCFSLEDSIGAYLWEGHWQDMSLVKTLKRILHWIRKKKIIKKSQAWIHLSCFSNLVSLLLYIFFPSKIYFKFLLFEICLISKSVFAASIYVSQSIGKIELQKIKIIFYGIVLAILFLFYLYTVSNSLPLLFKVNVETFFHFR